MNQKTNITEKLSYFGKILLEIFISPIIFVFREHKSSYVNKNKTNIFVIFFISLIIAIIIILLGYYDIIFK